jgi:hypothetical protein
VRKNCAIKERSQPGTAATVVVKGERAVHRHAQRKKARRNAKRLEGSCGIVETALV